MHYDYKPDCSVLWSGDVNRFKKNSGDLIEKITGSIIHDSRSQLCSLVIRLKVTKNSIFTGFLLEGRSTLRHILGKK